MVASQHHSFTHSYHGQARLPCRSGGASSRQPGLPPRVHPCVAEGDVNDGGGGAPVDLVSPGPCPRGHTTWLCTQVPGGGAVGVREDADLVTGPEAIAQLATKGVHVQLGEVGVPCGLGSHQGDHPPEVARHTRPDQGGGLGTVVGPPLHLTAAAAATDHTAVSHPWGVRTQHAGVDRLPTMPWWATGDQLMTG